MAHAVLLPRSALTHECPELDVHHDHDLRDAALPWGPGTGVAKEMDDVVGPNRMPALAELLKLSYLKTTWMECPQWRPPLPLGKLRGADKPTPWKGPQ